MTTLTPCTGSRRLASLASSIVLASVVAFAAVLIVWRLAQLRTTSTLVPADALVVVCALAALATLARLARPQVALRRIAPLPAPIQSAARRTMELSHFGAGPLTGWTTHHPDGSLGRIEPAVDVDEHDLHDFFDDEPLDNEPLAAFVDVEPEPEPLDNEPLAAFVDVEPEPEPEAEAEVVTHLVQRGETLWSLAESMLGDPKEWTTIRDLNVGRCVAVDTVMVDGDALRAGWSIVLPRQERSGTHVGS
jgi:nucleoid-associated protein YgaU